MFAFRNFALVVGIATLPLASCAAHPGPPATAVVQRLLRSASGNQALDVVRIFKGPGGLYGVVYQAGDSRRQAMVWITPDAQAVIPGLVVDAKRQDLTQLAQVQQGLKLSPTALWKYAASAPARSFTLGTAGPLLTAFVDPNCPFCHQLYENLQPGVASGRIRVRYVLVGIIRPNSAARAASLLAAGNITRAVARNESSFDVANEQGAYPIAPASTYMKYLPTITANNDALERADANATPTLVYCDKATRKMTTRSSSDSLASLLQVLADPAACGVAS